MIRKGIYLFIVILFAATVFLSGNNNIKFTQPRDSESWALESSHRVRWDNAGSGDVKIQLIQNGRIKGDIYSGFNSGNWRWFIKNYSNGEEIAAGNYTMKITKVSDPDNADEVNIVLLPKNQYYDFVIDDMEVNRDGKLTARVKNRGNMDFNGTLKFRIWENEQQQNDENHSLNIQANRISRKIEFSHNIGRGSCGVHVQLLVNPPPEPRQWRESDYTNNSLMKQVFYDMYKVKLIQHLIFGGRSFTFRDNIPTIVVNPGMATKIKKVHPRSATASVDYLEVTVPIKVHIRNCGYAEMIRDVWVKIEKALIGDEYQILYHRKPHQIRPGSTIPLTLYPKFKLIPANNRIRIKMSGGFRQQGGHMSVRQTGGNFFVDVVFRGFEEHYR